MEYPSNELVNIMNGISVLLFFLGIIFEYIRVEINKIIQKETPDKRKIQERKKLKKVYKLTLIKSILVLLILLLVAYMLLPSSLKIIEKYKFDLWSFDLLTSTFILIEIGIIMMTIIIAYKIIKLYRKISILS